VDRIKLATKLKVNSLRPIAPSNFKTLANLCLKDLIFEEKGFDGMKEKYLNLLAENEMDLQENKSTVGKKQNRNEDNPIIHSKLEK
jgi:hypothetical protein